MQGSLILEGASMCLLSKCIPAALRGGKSIFNAGKAMPMSMHSYRKSQMAEFEVLTVS